MKWHRILNRLTAGRGPASLAACTIAVAACNSVSAGPDEAGAPRGVRLDAESTHATPVTGSAVHYFSSAVLHSQREDGPVMVRRSTEIILLTGDLSGYILYHPTSTIDPAAGRLVTTGTQMFSGTVLGSDPVLLHDDRFRFDVDLSTGAATGSVFLSRSNDAPHRGFWFDCALSVVGTGMTPEGDATADYSGECIRRGSPQR